MLIQFQPRQEVCDAYFRRRQLRTDEYNNEEITSNFERLALGCIEADFLQPSSHFVLCVKIYKIATLVHRSKFKNSEIYFEN